MKTVIPICLILAVGAWLIYNVVSMVRLIRQRKKRRAEIHNKGDNK